MARTRLAAGAARRLLSRLGIQRPPVDVRAVAQSLGVGVKEEDFPDNISGVLVRSDLGVVIAINKHHHENRKRFSIAHECAHLILHPDSAAYYDPTHNIGVHFRAQHASDVWDPKEVEANRFAAELLMPRRMIIRAIQDSEATEGGGVGEVSAAGLARQFEVSEEAMTYRLADLRMT